MTRKPVFTKVEKVADRLWNVKRGDIVVSVNLRMISDKHGPAILAKMGDQPLSQMTPLQARDLRLAMQAVERLLKRELK